MSEIILGGPGTGAVAGKTTKGMAAMVEDRPGEPLETREGVTKCTE